MQLCRCVTSGETRREPARSIRVCHRSCVRASRATFAGSQSLNPLRHPPTLTFRFRCRASTLLVSHPSVLGRDLDIDRRAPTRSRPSGGSSASKQRASTLPTARQAIRSTPRPSSLSGRNPMGCGCTPTSAWALPLRDRLAPDDPRGGLPGRRRRLREPGDVVARALESARTPHEIEAASQRRWRYVGSTGSGRRSSGTISDRRGDHAATARRPRTPASGRRDTGREGGRHYEPSTGRQPRGGRFLSPAGR